MQLVEERDEHNFGLKLFLLVSHFVVQFFYKVTNFFAD